MRDPQLTGKHVVQVSAEGRLAVAGRAQQKQAPSGRGCQRGHFDHLGRQNQFVQGLPHIVRRYGTSCFALPLEHRRISLQRDRRRANVAAKLHQPCRLFATPLSCCIAVIEGPVLAEDLQQMVLLELPTELLDEVHGQAGLLRSPLAGEGRNRIGQVAGASD